jgi:parvulin-like peptidyl-prolyl isomerase
LYTKPGIGRWLAIYSPATRSVAMAKSTRNPLTAEQEAEAEVLAERIRQATADDFLQLARLLVGKPTREIFGQTEFQVRDILLRAGAKVYTEYLAEKKTATKGAV